MINLSLLEQRGWRLLTGRKTYKDLCNKQWTLCPSEMRNSPAAIYLDGELEKVTAVHEETTYAAEVQRVQGGVKEHAATIAYQLQNAQIHHGYLYKKAVKFPLIPAKESFFASGETVNIAEAALACTVSGNQYFGHWMTDDLTLTLAAQQLAKAVRTAQNLTNHQVGYSQLLDIHSTPVTQARFKELILIEDFGQNQFKQERYEYVRSKLKPIDLPQTKPGVMLLRSDSGVKRLLVNENEVAEFLRDRDFTILNPREMSAKEIVFQTSGAKIIVGVEGSQLTHGLFTCAEKGVFLALQPPYRFNNVYKDYADCLGLRYSFVVGDPVSGGFEINLETLAKTLDKIDSIADC